MMMIFHGLPFVFRVIMLNPGFVSSGNILCQKLLLPVAALYENRLRHSLLTNTTAKGLRTFNWN